MSIPNDLKDFALFMEGNFLGNADSGKPPKLTYKVEEWIGGGMAGPVDIDHHLEKLEAEFTCRGFQLIEAFGNRRIGGTGLRFVGSYQDDSTGLVTKVEHIMRGKFLENTPGDLKRGDPSNQAVKANLSIYELHINDQEVIFIDLINGVERYNGNDVRSDIRQALGI